MKLELTDDQKAAQLAYRAFVRTEIIPHAGRFDQEQQTPFELIRKLAHAGYLGAVVPAADGGTGQDMLTFGLLNEALGRGCSSVRSLLTVHSMVTYALYKWGNKHQKAFWLPRLIAGDVIGAFGLSEPSVGSDAKSIATTATAHADGFVLDGHKKWTTYGQIADVFLVFANYAGKLSAFLVERTTPGFVCKPIQGMLGTRASMLAELHFDTCLIPKDHLVGGVGFGLATVATSALDIGRYSVAWGSVGIVRACLEESLHYAATRRQGGALLKDHQLIRQMLTNMTTDLHAARLLCCQAGYRKDTGDPNTVMETWIAKYFASVAANRAASDAVQIHGANGCSSDYAVQRYMRDAKIMEIIEGSSQIQQINIADYAYMEHSQN